MRILGSDNTNLKEKGHTEKEKTKEILFYNFTTSSLSQTNLLSTSALVS